jgi:hypothetical protein
MSKIKFEKAMRLIEGEFINQLSWWPEWFPPVNLAVLQAPLKDEVSVWQAAIESAVKTGELASTPKPYLWRPPVFILTKEFSEQVIPCDQDTITATDFAAWLTAQDEKPSEFIAAWFAAVGVQAGTVNAMTTAKPAPVETASNTPAKPSALAWSLKTSIQRAPGYRWPLYQTLQAAHIAGLPCPKARDVLDSWSLNPPPELQVMPDGVKYNSQLGKPKEADLKAIGQAIKNLLNPSAG